MFYFYVLRDALSVIAGPLFSLAAESFSLIAARAMMFYMF